MPSTAATRLTQAHRSAQAHLGQQTIAGIRRAWSTLDLNNLDDSFDAWLAAITPLVGAQRTVSARLAANYLTVFRQLELPKARPIVPTLAETVNAEQLATSLRVTGPVSLKANIGRGMELLQAATIADERSAESGARYVLDGGRETITQTAAADKEARGWVWVAEPGACDYCVGLDGVVFYLGETEFQAHDHCGCTSEIAY